MIRLFKSLHFQKNLTIHIIISLLKELAVLCDQYGLSDPLNPSSRTCLQAWPDSSHGGVDSHAKWLWISYALVNKEYLGAVRKASCSPTKSPTPGPRAPLNPPLDITRHPAPIKVPRLRLHILPIHIAIPRFGIQA